MRRASAAARSAMKVVAVASAMAGGRCSGRCCLQAWYGWGWMSYRTSSGGRACAAVVAPGSGLGLGLAAGCGCGAPTGLGGCLAAVLGCGRVSGAGLVEAWALAAAGLLEVGTGLAARLGGFPRGMGGGVLDEDVVVVVDDMVVVVEVVESEAEERPWGTAEGPALRGRL